MHRNHRHTVSKKSVLIRLQKEIFILNETFSPARDVHNRDVVNNLVVGKVDHGNAFAWQAQLRHRWDFKLNDCCANICDAQFANDYEHSWVTVLGYL